MRHLLLLAGIFISYSGFRDLLYKGEYMEETGSDSKKGMNDRTSVWFGSPIYGLWAGLGSILLVIQTKMLLYARRLKNCTE
jgi:hypothetical protein